MGKLTGFTLFFFYSSLIFGQSNLATLNGEITDPSSHGVPNAAVKVRSGETGAARSTTTSLLGAYQIPGLLPGEYIVEVQALGFATTTRATRLEVGQNLRLNLGLTIGETKTTIEAEGRAETLKTEDAGIGEVVEAKSVR